MSLFVSFYLDEAGDWRWRAASQGNHKVLAVSSEGYENKGDCVLAALMVMGAGTDPVHDALTRPVE